MNLLMMKRRSSPATQRPYNSKSVFFEAVNLPVQKSEKYFAGKKANGNAMAEPVSLANAVGAGRNLDKSERQFFEQRIGRDFSNVIIHTDEAATISARSIHALAYTTGNHIVFDKGQFDPATSKGKRLLAHELTHVVQQTTNPENTAQVQRTPQPAVASAHSDAAVQQLINDALSSNGNDVDGALHSLMRKRCQPETCYDENLAAAEHYMFARFEVQIDCMPAEVMLAAIVSYGAVKLIAVNLGLEWYLSFCPDVCPITPTSQFQMGWASKGVSDGLKYTTCPKYKYVRPPRG